LDNKKIEKSYPFQFYKQIIKNKLKSRAEMGFTSAQLHARPRPKGFILTSGGMSRYILPENAFQKMRRIRQLTGIQSFRPSPWFLQR
jgi:hypothetical protein